VTLRLTLERAGGASINPILNNNKGIMGKKVINFYYLSFQVTLRLTLEIAGDQHWRQG